MGVMIMNITAEMLVEKAKENGKELTLEQAKQMLFEKLGDEELDEVAGGAATPSPKCPQSPIGAHKWEDTGNKKPGQFFGDLWPDVERRCAFCGETMWFSN